MRTLVTEIHLVGRELAQLIGPGSSVPRRRRSEIRALVREGFLVAQDASDESALLDMRDTLVAALRECEAVNADEPPETKAAARDAPYGSGDTTDKQAGERGTEDQGPEPDPPESEQSAPEEPEPKESELADDLVRRRAFGVVDYTIVARADGFETSGLSAADHIAASIEARVERVLEMIGESVDDEEKDAALRTQDEARELITSKLE